METGKTYTLVREVDGIPVAVIEALRPETAEQQVQPGHVLVEGNWLGRWRRNAQGDMVAAGRDLSELQIGLIRKLMGAAGTMRNEDCQTLYGPVKMDLRALTKLLLAAATGHNQPFTFADGQTRLIMQNQFNRMAEDIYLRLHEIDQLETMARIRIEQATSQASIQDLVNTYWPDEGST